MKNIKQKEVLVREIKKQKHLSSLLKVFQSLWIKVDEKTWRMIEQDFNKFGEKLYVACREYDTWMSLNLNEGIKFELGEKEQFDAQINELTISMAEALASINTILLRSLNLNGITS